MFGTHNIKLFGVKIRSIHAFKSWLYEKLGEKSYDFTYETAYKVGIYLFKVNEQVNKSLNK